MENKLIFKIKQPHTFLKDNKDVNQKVPKKHMLIVDMAHYTLLKILLEIPSCQLSLSNPIFNHYSGNFFTWNERIRCRIQNFL